MFNQRYDLPFDNDISGKFLPWIIGITAFLTVMIMAGFITAHSVVARWQSELSGSMIVQVMADVNKDTKTQAERTTEVMNVLGKMPGVNVRLLPIEDSVKFLEPWLGGTVSARDLPLPYLIDVAIESGSHVSPNDIHVSLRKMQGVFVDDQQIWMKDLFHMIDIFKLVTAVIAILILGASIFVVIFATRAGLAIHAPIIDLLHILGAADKYVMRQFQRYMTLVSAKGSFIGLLAALCVILILQFFGGDESGLVLLPRFSFSLRNVLILACVPLVTVILSAVTARLVVKRSLSKMT